MPFELLPSDSKTSGVSMTVDAAPAAMRTEPRGGARILSSVRRNVRRAAKSIFTIDFGMKICCAGMLSFFIVSLLRHYLADTSRITLLCFAIAEAITLGLALASRAPKSRDLNPMSFVITLTATVYPLAFNIDPGLKIVPEGVAATVQIVGVVIQLYAKWSLRRSFGLLPANRGVVVSGAYRFVRHPMYAGYFVTDLGFILANCGTRNLIVIFSQWALQAVRLLREEKLLAHDETYREYASRVRYRVIRGVF